MSPRAAVFSIAAAAFLIRLLHVLSYTRFPTSDETHYYDIALNRLTFENLLTPDGLAFFPAGYPMFMKPFLLLFDGAAGLRAVQVAQAALGGVTCVLIYRLGRRVHSRAAGLAAGVAACLFTHFVFYSSSFMSEALFVPLYLLGLISLIAARERGPGRLFAAGLICGASVLVRPVGATLGPAVLYACLRGEDGRKRSAGRLLAFAAGLLTLMGPWALRNWIAYDHLVLIAPNDGFNFYIGNHAGATGRFNMPLTDADELWADRKAQFGAALEFLLGHPVESLFITLRLKWHAFWEFLQPWPMASSNPQLFAGEHFFPLISWRIILATGLVGLGALVARGSPAWWLTPSCLAAYLAFYMIFFGNSRFRHPCEAFFILWTGVAAAVLLRLPGRLRRAPPRSWAAGATVLIAAVLVQSAVDAAVTRSRLARSESLLASGEGFLADPAGEGSSFFGEAALPVDRSRQRYLRLSTTARRHGRGLHPSNLGNIKFLFLDRRGEPMDVHISYYMETLRRRTWESIEMKAQIPPQAAWCRVLFVPAYEFDETLEFGPAELRYSRGNDLALEFLFPYLRWGA